MCKFFFSLFSASLLLLSCSSSNSEDRVPSNGYVVSRFQGDESEVKSFASRYSAALMNQFNPETGHDAYYNVNSWSYDMSSNMYSIDMTAWWSGKPNAFADDCQSALTVNYHVARDGSSFSVGEPQINDCIRAGQNSDVIWDIFVNEMSK